MATTDFVDAKSFLAKDYRGTSLYNHLTEVILKILNDRPTDALTVLEEVSRTVRGSTFSAGSGLGSTTKGKAAEAACSASKTWAANCSALHGVEESPVVMPFAGDLSTGLEWAGVSLGDADTFLITQALNLVAAETDAQSVRFFGKIMGTKADYYIIEVLPKKPVVAKSTEEMEGSEGANKYVYYVAPSPDAAFVALPPLKASHVVASTTRKRYLTGNLDAPVPGHPPFKGTEKDFLHAIIARINGDTNLCLDGYYERDEETEEIIKTLEYEAPELEALTEAAGWKHTITGLNEASGRVIDYVDPEGEEEPEEWKEELRDLEEDDWTFFEALKDSMVCAKSKLWPGAVSVSDGTVSTNVYIGYGIPSKQNSTTAFSPVAPPALPEEYGAGDPEETEQEVPVEQEDDTKEPEVEEEEENGEEEDDD